MENKPYYALFVYVGNDLKIKLTFLKIEQHKIKQENNTITLLLSREGRRCERNYVYAKKVEDLEDTYSFTPTEQELRHFILLVISKDTTPYATLAKLHSYTTAHTDNYYSKCVQETIKNITISKHLRHTLKQLFNDNIDETVMDVHTETRTITTTSFKQAGGLTYKYTAEPISF